MKIVIMKNNALGQIKWEQMVFFGNPEFGCELQPIDFAGVAQACGMARLHQSRNPATCSGTLREALVRRSRFGGGRRGHQ